MGHTIYKNANKKRLKSVTTIINQNLGWSKGALLGWQLKLFDQGLDPRKELKKAGNIGTLAHKMIEEFIKGGSVNLDKYQPEEISRAKNAYYNFYEWQTSNDVEFYKTEMKLVSEKYQYGGTFDAIARVNDKLVLVDFKTSNNAYTEFLIQMAAYKQLWEEHMEKEIQNSDTIELVGTIRGGLLLQLDKEEKKYKEYFYNLTDLKWGWKMFKLLLKIQENKR
tara:strand:+ start:1004 stop:1669 length:666 start_codon:yes stop_codon:yes gene_type:complete